MKLSTGKNSCVNAAMPVALSSYEYEPLLFKIAFNFGFDLKQIKELIKLVSALANIHHNPLERFSSFKIRICRIMVHKCIFLISSELCNNINRNPEVKNERDSMKYASESKNEHRFRVQDIPLSFRSVFILSDKIGFSDTEIAEMLNLTPIEVKTRFKKARSFINHAHA
jgi:DNA-directed RNA polymerase specialized sigma24 family protein